MTKYKQYLQLDNSILNITNKVKNKLHYNLYELLIHLATLVVLICKHLWF